MIASFLLSFVGIAANENSLWNIVTSAVEDAFSDDELIGDITSGALWEEIDFGEALSSLNTELFDEYLEEIEFNDFLNGTNMQLEDMLELAGNTTGMNTTEIMNAVKAAGFDPETMDWEEDVDPEDMLDQLNDMVMEMEALAFIEGMNLSQYTSLEDMQDLLSEFGYEDLYDLSDIEEYLENTVGENIPVNYTEYLNQLDGIEEEMEDIINGESDAPSLDEVLSDVEDLRDDLESEGSDDLETAIEGLEAVIEVLETFNSEPIDILMGLSADLQVQFEETNYFDEMDNLTHVWLGEFRAGMEGMTGSSMYELCGYNYAQSIIKSEYDTVAEYDSSCEHMPPSCSCLEGTGLYDNPYKEDVLNSLDCYFDDSEDITVKQTLLDCHGADIRIVQMRDAFEQMEGVSADLADDRGLTQQYEDISNALEELGESDIVSDGSAKDYTDSMSSWIEKFEELLDELDEDGEYREERQEITDLLDDALTDLKVELSISESDESEEGAGAGSKSGLEWWVVLIIVIAVLAVGLLIVILIRQRNRKRRIILARSAIEIEGEEGVYAREGAPARTGDTTTTTAGELQA